VAQALACDLRRQPAPDSIFDPVPMSLQHTNTKENTTDRAFDPDLWHRL